MLVHQRVNPSCVAKIPTFLGCNRAAAHGETDVHRRADTLTVAGLGPGPVVERNLQRKAIGLKPQIHGHTCKNGAMY